MSEISFVNALCLRPTSDMLILLAWMFFVLAFGVTYVSLTQPLAISLKPNSSRYDQDIHEGCFHGKRQDFLFSRSSRLQDVRGQRLLQQRLRQNRLYAAETGPPTVIRKVKRISSRFKFLLTVGSVPRVDKLGDYQDDIQADIKVASDKLE
ncbi:hypothetical protein A0H81_07319 [Grifola frondosa]|uniref:Uncharacterized protein n=1 Tax=Grifola frondosa TaxID=5627 RepID=A0A1C7M7A9_GRIFR|nr:hypothetical protein A0H81_07319 [Grifola frondosa]